ncbi:putative aminopeptidase [Neolecta irregularis DAH-3]|uniref:Putative aminopeptidase n=1 Tax=Neolecta irregularis (strain DAH-3) TaxID=1198029 RepID=A0A1U7LW62_NEOID|nr:putative aminopeptidase [Neolecta irregularis DAH-3]|eukprot:OLL26920.1 putative aminopeptidase [Neolecta irregularis DAH-3]
MLALRCPRLPCFARRFTSSTNPDSALIYFDPQSSTLSSSISNSSEILDLWKSSGAKDGQSRVLWNVGGFKRVGVASLKDGVRSAAATAVKALKDNGAAEIVICDGGNAHAAAEGSHLALFSYDQFKSKRTPPPKILALSPSEAFECGKSFASAQNLARELMETPGNHLTPTKFCERAMKESEMVKNLQVVSHGKEWIESEKMTGLLSVAKGSTEEPKFLEIRYTGGGKGTIGLVGKGVTFDSGGISIKPSNGMKDMRGDMGGAATIFSTTLYAAKLGLPINIHTCIPLAENMPGGNASRPGDIITMRNDLTVEIDNTDAEGRIILADALHYLSCYKPDAIIDAATLTGAIEVALGNIYSAVFSTSTPLFTALSVAGEFCEDEFWRMPLSKHYKTQIEKSNADLCNVGSKRGGGACTAAEFLKPFVGDVRWAHVDIAGVMMGEARSWDWKGMSGRPTRSFLEFLRRSPLETVV